MERRTLSSASPFIAANGRLPRAGPVLAAVCSCLLLGAGARQFAAPESSELPKTEAGRRAAAYLGAFNSGDPGVMRAFSEEHLAREYLERHPLEQRSSHYRQMHGIFGGLTVVRIALSLNLQLTVLADAAKTDNPLVMRFQLEAEPPHRLAHVTYSGIDNVDVPDEYVAYVATRAAPVDPELRAGTIQSLARAFSHQYVYPDVGRKIAETLLAEQAKGRYDDARTAGKLADLLTEHAVAASNDRHVWVEAQNPMLQESSDPVNSPAETLRSENYHVSKVEVFPGNIGYLKFDMIHDDREALEIVAAALDSLAG